MQRTKAKDDASNQLELEEMKKKASEFRVWSYAGLTSDALAGFLSWSLSSNLAPTVFFIPMVKMAYTGWEVFLLTWGVVGLFAFPKFKEFVGNYFSLFRFLSLVGFLCQWVDDNGFRIGVNAFGNKQNCINNQVFKWTCSLYSVCG